MWQACELSMKKKAVHEKKAVHVYLFAFFSVDCCLSLGVCWCVTLLAHITQGQREIGSLLIPLVCSPECSLLPVFCCYGWSW